MRRVAKWRSLCAIYIERLGAFERRAEGLLGNESVLHVDPDALLVHPARVGLGVVLFALSSYISTRLATPSQSARYSQQGLAGTPGPARGA